MVWFDRLSLWIVKAGHGTKYVRGINDFALLRSTFPSGFLFKRKEMHSHTHTRVESTRTHTHTIANTQRELDLKEKNAHIYTSMCEHTFSEDNKERERRYHLEQSEREAISHRTRRERARSK